MGANESERGVTAVIAETQAAVPVCPCADRNGSAPICIVAPEVAPTVSPEAGKPDPAPVSALQAAGDQQAPSVASADPRLLKAIPHIRELSKILKGTPGDAPDPWVQSMRGTFNALAGVTDAAVNEIKAKIIAAQAPKPAALKTETPKPTRFVLAPEFRERRTPYIPSPDPRVQAMLPAIPKHEDMIAPADPTMSQQDYNLAVFLHWYPTWANNAAQNYAEEVVHPHKDVTFLMNEEAGSIGLIAGSGPGLDENIEQLKRLIHVPTIMCSISSLRPLLANGIKPKYVSAYDCADSLARYLLGIEQYTKDMIMLASTCLAPVTRKRWKGDIYWYNQIDDFEFFRCDLEFKFPKMYRLPNVGCVVNNMLQLSCNILGFETIVLLGVDFAFTDGKSRCTQYEILDGQWVKQPAPADRIGPGPVLVREGDHITRKCDLTYRWGLERVAQAFAQGKQIKTYNATPKGILGDAIPRINLLEFLKGVDGVQFGSPAAKQD